MNLKCFLEKWFVFSFILSQSSTNQSLTLYDPSDPAACFATISLINQKLDWLHASSSAQIINEMVKGFSCPGALRQVFPASLFN